MTKPPTISYLTDVWFAAGAANDLPSIRQRVGITRPLVVTDPGVVEVGIIAKLHLGSLPVFDDVETNPTDLLKYSPTLSLFNGKIRLSSMIDHKGNYIQTH